MNKPYEYLEDAMKSLEQLDKIVKDCDPASGVTFAVRRGVARDNEDVEDDELKRPWVTIELSNLTIAKRAMAELQVGLIENIKFWRRATEEDIKKSQAALEKWPKSKLS